MIDRELLAESLGRLDAGTRALLDLSLRRAIPDEQVAKVLDVEPSSIPPRRARGIAQLADMMEVPGPSELAALLIAIPELPEEAWGVPAPGPLAGNVSRARRAKAFRRVAVAASPLVALGAVMAAVLVSSSDHSGGSHAGAGAAGRGGGSAGAPAAASAPQAQQSVPSGSQVARVHHKPSHHATRRTRRHHRARHAAGGSGSALLAREPVQATPPRNVPVAFHPTPAPAPVAPQGPQHVVHHHAPAKPKKPAVPHTPAPAPAPVQTPSQPVSVPAPAVQNTPAVQVSAPVTQTVQSAPSPVKPPKPPVPQPYTGPPGGHDGGDDDHHGGCGDRGGHEGGSHSWHHGSPAAQPQSGGKPFTPPGLFRRRHGH
jgi:hypothetical protein